MLPMAVWTRTKKKKRTNNSKTQKYFTLKKENTKKRTK